MFHCTIGEEAELGILQMQHAEELFALAKRNLDHLGPWMPWALDLQTVDDEKRHIESSLKLHDENGGFSAGIWYQGSLAGGIGLHKIDWPHRHSGIGYWISAELQGKGLVTRSCRAVLDHAFEELNLNRMEICAAPENAKSRAIPERLGFTQEGVLRHWTWHVDHFQDLVIYSMLAGEWSKLKEARVA